MNPLWIILYFVQCSLSTTSSEWILFSLPRALHLACCGIESSNSICPTVVFMLPFTKLNSIGLDWMRHSSAIYFLRRLSSVEGHSWTAVRPNALGRLSSTMQKIKIWLTFPTTVVIFASRKNSCWRGLKKWLNIAKMLLAQRVAFAC